MLHTLSPLDCQKSIVYQLPPHTNKIIPLAAVSPLWLSAHPDENVVLWVDSGNIGELIIIYSHSSNKYFNVRHEEAIPEPAILEHDAGTSPILDDQGETFDDKDLYA